MKRLNRLITIGVLSVGALVSATPAIAICPDPNLASLQALGDLDVVVGEAVNLSAAPASTQLQALILTHDRGQAEATALARSLALEFGQNAALRQVVLIDGTRLRLFRQLVIAAIERTQPDDPAERSPYVSVAIDFEGDQIVPLQAIAAQVLPGVNPQQQSIALLLDASGSVVGGFSNLETDELAVRQCVRSQLSL